MSNENPDEEKYQHLLNDKVHHAQLLVPRYALTFSHPAILREPFKIAALFLCLSRHLISVCYVVVPVSCCRGRHSCRSCLSLALVFRTSMEESILSICCLRNEPNRFSLPYPKYFCIFDLVESCCPFLLLSNHCALSLHKTDLHESAQTRQDLA